MIKNKLLKEGISNYGYHPCEITPGLRKNYAIPVTFFLTVNEFGVKYVGK